MSPSWLDDIKGHGALRLLEILLGLGEDSVANSIRAVNSTTFPIGLDPQELTTPKLELVFIDSQNLNPGRQCRLRNSKLGGRPGRPRNPASSLSQRRLDNLPLGA